MIDCIEMCSTHTVNYSRECIWAFLATFGVKFSYLQIMLIYMIQQAYKYVSLSLWPCLTLFGLKITYILKLSGWGLEKNALPWEQNVLAVGAFSVELLAYQV